MAKKIFGVYLAKLDAPDSEAHTRLELPASPWELHDALDKVQLQENEELYLEVDDYYDFEYLAPHLDGADISLNELNDLAGQLAALDEVQGIAFEGLFSMEVQKKISTNGGIITPQDLRDLAVSAKTDCYHIVDAADDTVAGICIVLDDIFVLCDEVIIRQQSATELLKSLGGQLNDLVLLILLPPNLWSVHSSRSPVWRVYLRLLYQRPSQAGLHQAQSAVRAWI